MKWRDKGSEQEEESWKNLGLFKLKEESISDRAFISDWHTGHIYMDKINLLYYLLSWTLIEL